MNEHGATKEQAISIFRNALEIHECPVAQNWLGNWRVSYLLHTFFYLLNSSSSILFYY
jgi:hypothetical protein